VTPLTNTSYSVTGTGTNGCVSAEVVSTVSVNALPNIVATVAAATICVGETTSLSVTGGTSYVWSDAQTGANISITPTATATYTVIGTDVNGCENTAVVTQNVDLCTSISKQNKATLISGIYPNPNSGKFVVESDENIELTIINSLGVVVAHEKTTGAKTNLSIDYLSNGIYFIKATAQGKQQILKVIKE
jgi:hypothetical protein